MQTIEYLPSIEINLSIILRLQHLEYNLKWVNKQRSHYIKLLIFRATEYYNYNYNYRVSQKERGITFVKFDTGM